jgi:rubrerythrin
VKKIIVMDDLEFKTLTADELEIFLDTHAEKSYLLIDVRQPLEYERGHIPGAKLMPLMEVEANLFDLPSDRDLIFYCTNGGRSQWAASLAGEGEVCEKNVYHLMGGLRAGENGTLSGYPNIQIFDKDQNIENLLSTAMNLEKGAWRFYQHLSEKFRDTSIQTKFKQVSIAEKAHAALVYQFLDKFDKTLPPFEQLFQTLNGEIIEGGQTFEDICRHLERLDNQWCPGIIDLALKIEYEAFDLYRAMADRTEETDARTLFLSIAQAEKDHMRSVSRTYSLCPQN